MVLWLPNVLIACLWPRMGGMEAKKETLEMITRQYPLCYVKAISISLESLYILLPRFMNSSHGWVTKLISMPVRATRL